MKKLSVILLLFFSIGCQNADKKIPTTSSDVSSIISEFEVQLQKDVAEDNIGGSISAAVVKENKVIWAKAFGYADRENKILTDTSTIFRIGSITKSFTAFLMMKLVEEGIIKLEDPVELYFPEIKKISGYTKETKITFLQLANHTSGLINEPLLKSASAGLIENWENKLITALPTAYLKSKPGQKYAYSNIGYGILGLALSRAGHKSFMELIKEKIFIPLKMNSSFFILPDTLKIRLAVGMDRIPHKSINIQWPQKEHKGRGYKVPSGGIYSTSTDLAKFMTCNLGFNHCLKKANLDAMQTETLNGNGYGLGFTIFNNELVNLSGHSGSMAGYTAQFTFDKKNKYGVILLRNYNKGATDLMEASYNLLNKLAKLK